MHNELMAPVWSMIFVFCIYGGSFLVGLSAYLVRAFGIMKASQALGLDNGWLGFIPIGNNYQLGVMAGDIELGNRTVKKPGLWLALIPIFAWAVVFVAYMIIFFSMFASFFAFPTMDGNDALHILPAVIGMFIGFFIFYILLFVVAVISQVLRMMVLNRIFGYFHSGQKPVFYMLLSAFIPFAEGILLMKTSKLPVINPPPYHLCQGPYASTPYNVTPYYNGPRQPVYPQSPDPQSGGIPRQAPGGEEPPKN